MGLVILNAGQNYHIRGGSDQCQFALTELLQSYNHSVVPFAAADPRNRSTEWSRYFPEGVDFENPGPRDLLRFIYSRPAAKALQHLLQDVHIDIAHLHIYYGQLTTSIFKPLRKVGVPIVQTLHEYKIVCPVYTLLSSGEICQACQGQAFWHVLAKRCNRGSILRSALSMVESYVSRALGSTTKIDHFIAVSDFLRDKVIELGVPADKVTTVHNFIDASKFKPNTSPGEYFLFLGRLERLKGIFTLIEAASALNKPLLIVGHGSARSEIERLIEQNGLHHIQLLGFKQGEALQELIRNSICVVAPSEWYETFGLILIESFAHGRPVIASRIGGMTEVVSDGRDGLLFPPGNVEALRECLVWMEKHTEQAAEMGMLGRRKVEAQFDPETHYQKTMNVYHKVL